MRPIKYFFLKAKYNLFKKVSTSTATDFRLINGEAAFPDKYKGKWYVKCAPILSLLLLMAIAPAISIGIIAFDHYVNHNVIIHLILQTVSVLVVMLGMLFFIMFNLKGIIVNLTKEYTNWQIKKKFNSNTKTYVENLDANLLELEKYNIMKEKEVLEQALSIPQETVVHKKKMKI